MAYSVLLERTVNLPRSRVYERLADFGRIQCLLPDMVASESLEGSGVGSIRTLRVNGVEGSFSERLEALIPDRFLSYSMVSEVALPFERYHSVVQLDDAGSGRCAVRWGSNWFARGAPDAEVRAFLTELYDKILDGVEKLG